MAAELMDHLDELVDRIVGRAHREIPGYAHVPVEEIRALSVPNVIWVVQALVAEGRLPSAAELDFLESGAETRARQGIPLDALVRGMHLTGNEVWRHALAAAPRVGLDARELLDVPQLILDGLELTIARAVAAYGRVDREAASLDEHRRATFLHDVLFGPVEAPKVFKDAGVFGLSSDAVYLSLRARPTSEVEMETIQAAVATPPGGQPALLAIIAGDLAGLCDPAVTFGGLDLAVGIGPPAPITGLPHSFMLASRALNTALAFGLKGPCTFDQVALRSALLGDEELATLLRHKYLQPLLAEGEFSSTLIDTMRQLLAHGMRIHQTAKLLHVHPNTVRHRLRRFEEITGADLARADVLFEIWWALEQPSP